MSRLRRLIRFVSLAALGAAVYEEMRKDPAERTGRGMVAGLVPYDFTPPTFRRVRSSLWDPGNPRLFVPSVFGVGWTINFGSLAGFDNRAAGKARGRVLCCAPRRPLSPGSVKR